MSETAAHSRRLRWLRLGGVAVPVVAVLAFHLLQPWAAETVGARRAHLFTAALSVIAVVGFGITMFALLGRGYENLIQQKLEKERHLARIDELDRVARELHDSLAQVLGTVHLRLRALPPADAANSEEISNEVEDLADLCHAAFQDVREAIMGLRSLTRSEEPFGTALTNYARQYTRLGGPKTIVEMDGKELIVDPATQLHLLRIMQEALTNVRKHADATKVNISIDRNHAHHRVVVEDDGRGFDPERQKAQRTGFGLETMGERSELIGAKFHVASAPGNGTRISVSLPRSELIRVSA